MTRTEYYPLSTPMVHRVRKKQSPYQNKLVCLKAILTSLIFPFSSYVCSEITCLQITLTAVVRAQITLIYLT